MRSPGFVFILLAMASAVSASAPAETVAVRCSEPVFDSTHSLACVVQDSSERLFLQRMNEPSGEVRKSLLTDTPGASFPVLKKDGRGILWAVWGEVTNEGPALVVVEADARSTGLTRRAYSLESPALLTDIGFGPDGRPWMVWIEEREDKSSLWAMEGLHGRAWRLHSSAAGSLCSPRIVHEGGFRAWVFWTEDTGGTENIFYRVLDGGRWTPSRPFSLESRHPQIMPVVIADRRGRLWVLWSGHDGCDYEIYGRSWDGGRWSASLALTENEGFNDVNPRISLVGGLQPVVLWNRHGPDGSELCLRAQDQGRWLPELRWTCTPGLRAAVEEETIGLLRAEGTEFAVELRPWPHRPARPDPDFPDGRPEPPARPQIVFNPVLDESAYIGFGDSMTYGQVNKTDAPEKGYVPRLEAILTAQYGPSRVFNEGLGGETTLYGLARMDGVLASRKAGFILILEGTNDTIFNEFTPATTAYNLKEMCKKALAYGTFPFLATILPRYDGNARPTKINNTNNNIRNVTVELAIPLVDLYGDFVNYPESEGGVLSLLSEDLKHPSEKGYQFMAERWFASIRRFPFPPAFIQVARQYDKILFYQKPGNLITWQDNPKIQEAGLVQEYKIYRKLEAQDDSAYTLLATVSSLRHFDTDIDTSRSYVYILSTVRTDNVEGPCSRPVPY